MLDLWYKNAILYCLDVETYMDGNGDGVGDFVGLTQRLSHLAGLGITCIWLMPFYPTPNRDNGYDITDFYTVDPRLGTLGDFVEFTHAAHNRGIRVIVDLVVNHTSTDHPWFQAACRDKHSKYHNYYVWSETKPDDAEEGIVFPGLQETTWTYNEEAGAYYFHRFYDHQADLNIANPEVRAEINKIMGFWLKLGVSGFRIDAAPFLIELNGIEHQADVTDPYQYLQEIRKFLSWRCGDAILLAEANVPMQDVPPYFGDGDKMQMLFHFMLNQHLMLALAQEKAEPIARALKAPPAIPDTGQWAIFVRNHDELSLDKLTQDEQQEILSGFHQDREKVWIFDRGIRRRFPPLVQGNPKRLRLAYSLMFTLPGTPVLFYGEEIGMGDDLSQPERFPIRAPMQWSDKPNAGFSNAPADKLIRPIISDETFGYQHVNVVEQRRDSDSFLNWVERAIRVRKECPEFGWGTWAIVETDCPTVFAHQCEWQGGTVMAVHNLSREACTVTLKLDNVEDGWQLIDLLGQQEYAIAPDNSHTLKLEGYGYYWFRIGETNL
ncbi:alpha-glucosidase C-terminal domain-containing protein [Oscillatoria sp. FACHB-1407]|uniref:alpha-amylase family protein n=1 Tax=Oscillatoria sp. FACHB-1407 TaxID=2692847 RepID=UPI0016882087|nr:alpha-amylase family protein [Oscillatoria sp. FACHB-1407]MBD2459751.1 alpha-glucosidase C-terminal domain-containing protein [Oscillatoria sp. FACHB-1407]